jgi:hypothetical protein
MRQNGGLWMRVNWKAYEVSDERELKALQQQLNVSVGRDLELPDLKGKSIKYAMVAIEESGKILGCWYAEQVLELKLCSLDPRFSVAASRDCWALLCELAGDDGTRFIHCPVPKGANEAIAEMLTAKESEGGLGMYESENDFYVKDLR